MKGVLWAIFAIFYRLFELIWHKFLVFTVSSQKGYIPKAKNGLLLISATELAYKIRTRQIKSEDVIKAYVDRIKEVNPLINAVSDERFADALEDAKSADSYIRNSRKSVEDLAIEKPFLGVPVTTKNSVGIKGLIRDAGVAIKKGDRAEEDAVPIANLRQAGAIPLCITNVPEFLMWTDASNKLYGRTNNPFDLTKHPGGSTGGESALLSVAGSVFGVGTDIYGSVRSPSFNCGIFAHKPTIFVVSNKGQFPSCYETDLDNFNTTAPMCRYATDLLPMYKVMAGKNVSKLKLDKQVDLNKLKVYYTEDYSSGPFITPVDSEVKESITKVVDFLSDSYGIMATKIRLPVPTNKFMNIWMSKYQSARAPKMETLISNSKSFSIPLEFLKWCFRLSKHTLHCLVFLAANRYSTASNPDVTKENFDHADKLNRFFEDTLKDDGVFLFPTQPVPSYYHNEQFLTFYNNGYTSIFNILGFPVTQCPTGLSNKTGTPLGIQVVTTKHNDHLTLAVAVALEKGIGGWIKPFN